jgi:hypothetical protein
MPNIVPLHPTTPASLPKPATPIPNQTRLALQRLKTALDTVPPPTHISTLACAINLLGEPWQTIDPERAPVLLPAVREALEYLRPYMEPSPVDLIEAKLRLFASRCGAKGYTEDHLVTDADVLADMPVQVFLLAFRRAWKSWNKPWMPGTVFFFDLVAAELGDRREIYGGLLDLELKLSTIALKAQWDEEAATRHARQKAAEWAELRRGVRT